MMITLQRPFVLASASPRRAELLSQIGLTFTVQPARTPEPPPAPGQDLLLWARAAALDKARAIAATLSEPALVLGADTVVAIEDEASAAPVLHGQSVRVLGKPTDDRDAAAMLRHLSGREHTVLSAFALIAHPEGVCEAEVVETGVRFRALSLREIEAYIATGEPRDKAGAYGIQGRGAVLVAGISGDYYTVVGLPLARVWERLQPWMV